MLDLAESKFQRHILELIQVPEGTGSALDAVGISRASPKGRGLASRFPTVLKKHLVLFRPCNLWQQDNLCLFCNYGFGWMLLSPDATKNEETALKIWLGRKVRGFEWFREIMSVLYPRNPRSGTACQSWNVLNNVHHICDRTLVGNLSFFIRQSQVLSLFLGHEGILDFYSLATVL